MISLMREFNSLGAAVQSLPENARWSSIFGLQTKGGCAIVYRADGRCWSIGNGPFDAFAPFTWTVREISA